MTEDRRSPNLPEPLPPEAYGAAPVDHATRSERLRYAGEGEVSAFSRYLPAFLRYKWLIGLAALLGAGAAYVAWHHIEPEYEARGALWIQAGERGDRGPIVTDGLFQASSWLDLLRSYAVMDSVVMREKLYLDPDRPGDLPLFEGFEITESFLPGRYQLRVSEDGSGITLYRDRAAVDRGVPGDSLGRELGFLWAPPPEGLKPGQEVEFSLRIPRDASNRLSNALRTEMDPGGTFIYIGLRGRSPERLTATVNRLMERHVALAAELKTAHLDEEAQVLEQQLQYVQDDLEEGERALEGFRVQTITLPSDEARPIQPGLEMTRDPVFSEFFQMRVEQEQLRRDRERLERVLEALPESGLELEALEFIPAVGSSSQLQSAISALVTSRTEHQALLDRYTPEHPPVREVADRIRTLEQSRIPALVSQLVQQLRLEEQELAGRLDASEADLTEIPPRAIEEARLRRRVAIAENLYTELRSRYEGASLARASSLPDVRILDRAATPVSPSNDERVRLALLVFLGFLGAGVGGVLVLDRLDSRFRTPDQILGQTGLTVLGAVPRIRHVNGRKGQRNANQVHEAFRELRTNLGYAYGSAGPMVVTISSTGMEEGKTLVTTNLGVSFAQLGRRTLLLDGDTRRGDLHHYLAGERKPGLTDYLRERASLEDVLQRTAYSDLDFIGSGTHVSNSPELLSSPRMSRLLSELREGYDVILVDSPPLGAGADPVVLAYATGHLLLVIRSGTTHKEFTQAKLEPLGRVRVRMLGAVLNDYEPERLSQHFRYYGTYLPGYEAGEEETEEEETESTAPTAIGASSKIIVAEE